jgi:hypothetical protein
VAWRILHGALMVGGMRLRVSPTMNPADACCRACASTGDLAQLETLTHAFMDCPSVAPALDWLLRVYGTLAGEVPPRDALVVLADAHARWRPPDVTLWARMRVAFLGCAWAARCAPLPRAGAVGGGAAAPPAPGPAAAAHALVRRVVDSLTTGVQRDWRRVVSDVRQEAVGSLPTTWFRGRSPSLKPDQFQRLWPSTGGWFQVQPGVQHLVVRLSDSWPVAFAPAAAQPAIELLA